MKLWYKAPAKSWHEALPFGNGRLGGMVFGGFKQEKIQLNEDSVWTGKGLDRNNPDALQQLPEIRRLVRMGKVREAEQLALYALSGVPNSQRSYQTAGECYIRMQGIDNVSDYQRELDLEDGIIRMTCQSDKTVYVREIFSSYPDGIIVIHLKAEGEKKLNFDCHLERCHNWTDEVTASKGDQIQFWANTGSEGIFFNVLLKAVVEDGRTRTLGEHLIVEEASQVTLLLAIETSFYHRDYQEVCAGRIDQAMKMSYEELKQRHLEDYRALFGRLKLYIEKEELKEQLPTDERLQAVKNGADDVGLIETYFQFGRYLLLSSSREGSLPANLQGLWNHSLTPEWESKYTININTEMNYWLAGCGNLSECQLPLFDLLERMKENGKKTARVMYGCRGSMAHHNTDLFADTAPQDHYIPATFWVMGEAFLATHIWEHYQYTQNRKFLEEHFDVMEQCLVFFYDFLTELPDGTLAPCPSVSPENTYIMADGSTGCMCEGSVMDIQILNELIRNYIASCRVLNKEHVLIDRAQKLAERLPGLKIGKHGQLQEWQEDYDELEPGHRHVSHLYGVYPGTTITWQDTPEFMKAARVSLDRRIAHGGGYTGWSRAWLTLLWTRFCEGEESYASLKALLQESTFINLMDNHPCDHCEDGRVFQVDGNLAASAAVLEMLAHREKDRICLLPALPRKLRTGKVSGLCLKGGIELSMEWKDGAVIRAEFFAKTDQEVELVINGALRKANFRSGETYEIMARGLEQE